MSHFVWIPKYRHKVFEEPHREELKSIIEKIVDDYHADIVEYEVLADHIHLVVKTDSKTSSSSVTQVIKSISTRVFSNYVQRLNRNIFWEGTL